MIGRRPKRRCLFACVAPPEPLEETGSSTLPAVKRHSLGGQFDEAGAISLRCLQGQNRRFRSTAEQP
jgi:hypothetical protein